MIHPLLKQQLDYASIYNEQIPTTLGEWTILLEALSYAHLQDQDMQATLNRLRPHLPDETWAALDERFAANSTQISQNDCDREQVHEHLANDSMMTMNLAGRHIWSWIDEILRRHERPLTDPLDKLLDMMQQQANGLLALVKEVQVLDSFLVSLRRLYNPEWLDVDDLCRRLIEPFEQQGRVQYIGTSEPCWCNGDPRLIGLWVSHLLMNSLEHSPAEASVIIQLEADTDEIRWRVQDSSDWTLRLVTWALLDFRPQVKPPHLQKINRNIAEPYHGLSIARFAAIAHNGTLTFQQHSPVGRTFLMCIPRDSEIQTQ